MNNCIGLFSRKHGIDDLLALPDKDFFTHQHINRNNNTNYHIKKNFHHTDDPCGHSCHYIFRLRQKFCSRPVFKKFCPLSQSDFQITRNFTVIIHIITDPVHKAVDLAGHCSYHAINTLIKLWNHHLQQNPNHQRHKQQCSCHTDSSYHSSGFFQTLHSLLRKRKQKTFLEIYHEINQIGEHQPNGNRL